MQIRAKTIAEAHIKVCGAIEKCEDVIEFISEDGEVVWEYPEPILVIVEQPMSDDMHSPLCRFGSKAMSQYAYDLLFGTDSDFVYTYHDRLFHYTCGAEDIPNDYRFDVSQIDNIISKLTNDPTSRRAQAITWYPEDDMESNNPPCLQRIQFLVRDGKLNMDVNFRSNDCLSAMGQNMYALVFLQDYVATALGIEMGIYSHYITSAHFYPDRDAEEHKILKGLIYK